MCCRAPGPSEVPLGWAGVRHPRGLIMLQEGVWAEMENAPTVCRRPQSSRGMTPKATGWRETWAGLSGACLGWPLGPSSVPKDCRVGGCCLSRLGGWDTVWRLPAQGDVSVWEGQEGDVMTGSCAEMEPVPVCL